MMLKSLCTFGALFIVTCWIAQADENSGKLRVRVLDAATRKPLAARIVLRAADGTYPGDRIGLARDKWPNIEAHGIFTSGESDFDLPPGKTTIRASCGPQYGVEGREIEIIGGTDVVAELLLTRRIDLRKLGWVCGDAHLHMIHGEMQRATSYKEIALTCRANGLDWAYINQEYGGAGAFTLDDYHAACRQVSNATFQLLLGGERPKSLLGHNALIGVPNPFVVPDDPPYHRAAKSIHDQGGVLFPVHPVRYFPEKQYQGQWLDFPGNNLGREIIFDAYLGPSFDGLSVLSDEPDSRQALQLWFQLLNKGCFVPAFADSDACFDRPTLQKNVPGFWSTFLYVGPNAAVDNQTLAEAVRRGQTMATTGPLVMWSIDGHISGSTFPADGTPHQITIEVLHHHHNWTLEDARVAKIELIRNGDVVRVWEPNTAEVKISHVVHEREPCWYAVRALGSDSRWQVGLASPIYFAQQRMDIKRKPLTVRVRGRVFDFVTGQERPAKITVTRHEQLLIQFDAEGQFAVDMPLDATISAVGEGHVTQHELLLDYAPVHRFLWKLDRESLGNRETFEQFESLVRQVDLEFPLGYRMSGCYAAKELTEDIRFKSLRIAEGPQTAAGSVALATILLDKHAVQVGDAVNVAAVFHDEGNGNHNSDSLLVVEGRAYDARHPSGFNPLKVFDTFESKWSQAAEIGNGYRVVMGRLRVPPWAEAGPVDAVEINAFSRGKNGKYESHVGLRLPIGQTARALMIVSNWPTVPISWPDHNYGIGPLKLCGKLGREGQPHGDYRAMRMTVETSAGDFEISPERDCRGCADADDAIFTEHYFDQILNDESRLRPPVVIRPQPAIPWRDPPVIDATMTQ